MKLLRITAAEKSLERAKLANTVEI